MRSDKELPQERSSTIPEQQRLIKVEDGPHAPPLTLEVLEQALDNQSPAVVEICHTLAHNGSLAAYISRRWGLIHSETGEDRSALHLLQELVDVFNDTDGLKTDRIDQTRKSIIRLRGIQPLRNEEKESHEREVTEPRGATLFAGQAGGEIHRAFFQGGVLNPLETVTADNPSIWEDELQQPLIPAATLFPNGAPPTILNHPELWDGYGFPSELIAQYTLDLRTINTLMRDDPVDAEIHAQIFLEALCLDLRPQNILFWEHIHQAVETRNLLLAENLSLQLLARLRPFVGESAARIARRKHHNGLLPAAALNLATVVEARYAMDKNHPIILTEIRAARDIPSTRMDAVQLMKIDGRDPSPQELHIVQHVVENNQFASISEAAKIIAQALGGFSTHLPLLALRVLDLKSSVGDNPQNIAKLLKLEQIRSKPLESHTHQIERYCAFALVEGEVTHAPFTISGYDIIYVHHDQMALIRHSKEFGKNKRRNTFRRLAKRALGDIHRSRERFAQGVLFQMVQHMDVNIVKRNIKRKNDKRQSGTPGKRDPIEQTIHRHRQYFGPDGYSHAVESVGRQGFVIHLPEFVRLLKQQEIEINPARDRGPFPCPLPTARRGQADPHNGEATLTIDADGRGFHCSGCKRHGKIDRGNIPVSYGH